MDPDRGIEVGVGVTHDRRRSGARGQARDEHPRRIDRVLRHDLTGDAGDQRRLTGVSRLVGHVEPIPAPLHVGRLSLGGIGDEESAALGQFVHLRAGREIIRVLRAAVQHDDQRHRRAGAVARRHV